MFGVSDAWLVRFEIVCAAARVHTPGVEVAPPPGMIEHGRDVGRPSAPRLIIPLPVCRLELLLTTDHMCRMPPDSSVLSPRCRVMLPNSEVSCVVLGTLMKTGTWKAGL